MTPRFESLAKASSNYVRTVNLVDYSVITPEVAKVTFTTRKGEYKAEDVAEAASALFANQVSIVEESVMKQGQKDGRDIVTALARKNQISIPYEEGMKRKGMVCASADTFIDEDETTIWAAVGDGDERRLVQKSNDDLNEILSARKQYMRTPETASAVLEPKNGNYVMYYQPKQDKIGFGMAFRSEAGLQVFDRKSEQPVAVDPRLIIETAENFDQDGENEVVFAGLQAEKTLEQASVSVLLDYYRKIYKNTAFFVHLEKLIRSHVTV